MKNHKSGKGRVGPCETHLDLLPGTCQSWTTTVPQRLGDRDPIFKYWPEQTIGFKGAYSFLRQALQGCDFELLEATSAFVTFLGGKVNTYLSGELEFCHSTGHYKFPMLP